MKRNTSPSVDLGALVKQLQFEVHIDDRGQLCPIEFAGLPFEPRRIFFVVPARAGETRGGHAHKTAHELLVCVDGEIHVAVAYGGQHQTFILDRPGRSLYLAPMVWAEQTYSSVHARLIVLSNEGYDPDSYSHGTAS